MIERVKLLSRGFDLAPLFIALILAFAAVAAIELSSSWPDAQRGLLLFEKTCPLSQSPHAARR
jgi:hypothetical protein